MLMEKIASQDLRDDICRKLASILGGDVLRGTERSFGVLSSVFGRKILPGAELSKLHALVAAYDQSTNAHASRLVHLTESVALHLHLPKHEIYLMCLAALLHDIGKIFIPSTILHKSGSLNDEEWRTMRCHPEIGYHMLQRIGGIFGEVAPLVMAHHERWDGGGYPAGLAGEEIPLGARILAVVDSYDAMTSTRSYQKPLSSAQACEELQRCVGSQYDSHVVTAFLAVLRERNVLTAPGEGVKRNHEINGAGLVGGVPVAPLPRSDERALLSV